VSANVLIFLCTNIIGICTHYPGRGVPETGLPGDARLHPGKARHLPEGEPTA
ncbi:unnamed protein product, partial [Gadus morhua 'NCC']